MQKTRANSSGFTLIELSVVVFIIGIMAAVAFPRFLPILAFSQLEGAGRHLANYGRGTIAQAALMRDDVVFYFDMDKQQFWCTRWIYPDPMEGEGEEGMLGEGEMDQDQLALLNQFQAGGGFSAEEMSEMLLSGQMAGADGMPEGFDQDLADQQMGDKFDRMARRALEARAANVIQDESFLGEIGPLFDKKFSIDGEELEEPYEEEILDPTLRRAELPVEVTVTDIYINGERHRKGLVDIPIGPLGLLDEVIFYITNDEGEFYSVIWDPVLNSADLVDGKVDL